MTKNFTFLVFLFLSILAAKAQNIGINGTGAVPDPSAMLDVVATDKGILIPRVALTSTTAAGPITAPATSMLVYNTATAGVSPNDVTPGFYYWDGTKWIAQGGNGGKDWALTGNAGTNVATDFFGTRDAQDLALRTNNTERMRIESGGDIGIGTTTPAHSIHAVVPDIRFESDFVNQEAIGVHSGTPQNIPFANGVFNPLTGTVQSISISDGNGTNNSAVFISAFARVFGGSLNGGNSSMGGYFMILQRDTNPAFTTAVNLTYTSGTCFIKTPNGLGSAAIGYGGGGHVSYIDMNLTAGTTYYYRLVLYPNGVGITSGTYDVYQRDLTLLQIKR